MPLFIFAWLYFVGRVIDLWLNKRRKQSSSKQPVVKARAQGATLDRR